LRERGGTKKAKLGNGLTFERDIWPTTGLLKGLRLASGQTSVHREEYAYYPTENLAARALNGTEHVDTYFYDALGRLTDHAANQESRHYDYDAYGNLIQKPGIGTLTYDYQDRPHFVRSTEDEASAEPDAPKRGFEPDVHGRQTTRSGEGIPGGLQKIKYTSFDLPVEVTSGQGEGAETTRFQYDASGARVREDVVGRSTTVHVGNLLPSGLKSYRNASLMS
jgi:YD repeat-containing protein